MTNPNFGPNCRQNELSLRLWHRREKIEEALLTSLKDWAKLPPTGLGNLAGSESLFSPAKEETRLPNAPDRWEGVRRLPSHRPGGTGVPLAGG